MTAPLFLIAPFLTVIIELSVWQGFRLIDKAAYTKHHLLWFLVGINLLTNSILQIIILLLLRTRTNPIIELFLEAIIVVAEWRLLDYAYKGQSKQWLFFSIVANSVSYAVGLLLFPPVWL